MTIDRRGIGVAGAGVCTFLNVYCTQSLLPTIAAEFHVPLPQTGLVVTATLLAVAIVAPFVGSISDMLGRKRLIVSAAFGLALPTLLAATSGTLGALIFWRFLQGVLAPFVFAVTVAYVGDEVSGGAAIRLAGTFSMGAILGGFSGRLVAGVVAQLAGWRASFVALTVLTLLTAAAIGVLLPRERNFHAVSGLAASLRSFGEHLRNRRLLATYAIGFGVLFSQVAAFTFINFVLAAPPYGLGPAQLGLVFTIYLLGLVVTPLGARVAVRIGRRPALAGAVALGVSGLLITLLPGLGLIMAGLSLVSCTTFLLQTFALGYIGAAARSAKSAAVGLYVTCYYVGGSLGGILPAGVWHRAGWPGCVALIIFVQLFMLAVGLAFWREPAAHLATASGRLS